MTPVSELSRARSKVAVTARNAEDFARLAPLAAAWEAEARRTFLDAYDQTAGGGHAALDAARGLLPLFELEKALYELRYELGNRPDWVVVPLQGIAALLG